MESESSISIASLSRNCWKLVATKGFLTLSVVFVPGVDPLMYFEGGNHGKKFSDLPYTQDIVTLWVHWCQVKEEQYLVSSYSLQVQRLFFESSLMEAEGGTVAEHLCTVFAFVGFVSCVDFPVLNQGGPVPKGFPKVRTLVESLIYMHPLMQSTMLGQTKGLCTCTAFIRSQCGFSGAS